jgi:hypothetical protein
MNSYPAVCETPELVTQFNRAWKAISDASLAKLLSRVSRTHSPHLPLARCPTCARLVQQRKCVITHPGNGEALDSDHMPRGRVLVRQARNGMAQVRLKGSDQILWTATANLEFNKQLAVDQTTEEVKSHRIPNVDLDADLRNLPQAAGWTLEGGKVCADNIALSPEADCLNPDVNTKCALVIDGAAEFVIGTEEQEKFAEMSGSPQMFSKSERIRFLKHIRREACPNYPAGTPVSLALLDQSDEAVVFVRGSSHPWYASPDNLAFGEAPVRHPKGSESR